MPCGKKKGKGGEEEVMVEHSFNIQTGKFEVIASLDGKCLKEVYISQKDKEGVTNNVRRTLQIHVDAISKGEK